MKRGFLITKVLANMCMTEEKHVGAAGTKERRGKTTQRVLVSMVSDKQILAPVSAGIIQKLLSE